MPDWSAMFTPAIALGEVIARASIMYLLLFAALRFLLKREGGAVNTADLLVVVAIVDGAQPAFVGKADSITESLVFVLTVIGWSTLINWASFHYPRLRWFTASPPILLVQDGRLRRDGMRRALITFDELMQQLREHGVDEVSRVRRATMESDGEISVIEMP